MKIKFFLKIKWENNLIDYKENNKYILRSIIKYLISNYIYDLEDKKLNIRYHFFINSSIIL